MRMLLQPFLHHSAQVSLPSSAWAFQGSGTLPEQQQQQQPRDSRHCRRFLPRKNQSPKKFCKELEPGFIQYPVSPTPDKLKSSLTFKMINMMSSNNHLHVYYTNTWLPKLLKSVRTQQISGEFTRRQRLSGDTMWASFCSDTEALVGRYWIEFHCRISFQSLHSLRRLQKT